MAKTPIALKAGLPVALTSKGMSLHQALLQAGADKAPIAFPASSDNVTRQELKTKKIVFQVGGGPGKAGKLQFNLPMIEVFESTRKPRGASTKPIEKNAYEPKSLSINALKAFLKEIEEALVVQLSGRQTEADKAIGSLKSIINKSNDDKELNDASKALQAAIQAKAELRDTIVQEIVGKHKRRGPENPLSPVYDAMLGK